MRAIRNAIAVLAMSTGACVWAADGDAGFGTWKLDAGKSKFAGAAPKSLSTNFQPNGEGVKWSVERVDAEGKASRSEFSGIYDGKDYPLTGSPNVDAVTLRRIDPYTTERINKKDGKIVSVETRTVAKDGKSYTTKVKSTNAKGEATETVMVFDKQ